MDSQQEKSQEEMVKEAVEEAKKQADSQTGEDGGQAEETDPAETQEEGVEEVSGGDEAGTE